MNGESSKKYFAESVTFTINNKIVAETGRISKSYLAKFDIGQDVFYSHLDWDYVLKMIKNNTISYRELPKYPSVRRDLAILVDKSIKFGQIKDIAFRTEKNVLKEVGLFDVYESDNIGINKKSYAVNFILRDDLKTMTDKNIEQVMNKLIRAFESEFGAKIR
jgi:phenylalanyl-tRNA synthetase beta chain